MYYSYVEIAYVATSLSPTKTNLAVKLLRKQQSLGACRNLIFCMFVRFLAGFLFESSFFSESRLCTQPLFLVILSKIWIGWPANQTFEFLRGVNHVGNDCRDLQPYNHNIFSKILRAFFASRN